MKVNFKKSILTLIEDNIANFKLISSLGKIGIDANVYYINSIYVILDLLNVKNEQRRTVLYTEYYAMIRNASKIDIVNERKELRETATQIYKTLKFYSSVNR